MAEERVRSNVVKIKVKAYYCVPVDSVKLKADKTEVVIGETVHFTVECKLEKRAEKDVEWVYDIFVNGKKITNGIIQGYKVKIPKGRSEGSGKFELTFKEVGDYEVYVEGPNSACEPFEIPFPIVP